MMKATCCALLLAGACLSLQACVYLAAPATTAVIGGAGLVLKGAELQGQVNKADAQEAIDVSFDKTWNASITALLSLDIDVTLSKRTEHENGGLVEAKSKDTTVKVVIVKITDKITEFGITATHPGCLWSSHDKALAKLIADKTLLEARKQADN